MREKVIFADCQAGNHILCLVEWPETALTKHHVCECSCHEVKPPRRYCVRCKTEIDPKRVMRSSSFCSNECRKEDLKARRDFRAARACRLCGRPAKHKKMIPGDLRVCDGSTGQESASQPVSGEAK